MRQHLYLAISLLPGLVIAAVSELNAQQRRVLAFFVETMKAAGLQLKEVAAYLGVSQAQLSRQLEGRDSAQLSFTKLANLPTPIRVQLWTRLLEEDSNHAVRVVTDERLNDLMTKLDEVQVHMLELAERKAG